MRFSIDWLAGARNAAAEERATAANLTIFLNEQNVTQFSDDDSSYNFITVCMYGIADGLSHDWWNIFGSRDKQFSLAKYRGGFAFPDIRMAFDGEAFEIFAKARAYDNPPVRFGGSEIQILPRSEAELKLSDLISLILERLDNEGIECTSARTRWQRVQRSRMDPEEALFCEAAGALGLDPYQIDEVNARLIDLSSALFSGEALDEFLAGSAKVNQFRLLEWVKSMESRPSEYSILPDLSTSATDAASETPPLANEKSWSLGYRRARMLRRILGLEANRRFHHLEDLAGQFGATSSFCLGERVDGIRALRSDKPDGVHIHLRSFGEAPWAGTSHLFNFARAVGDAVCFPSPARAPINELRFAHRQSASRAFAAEFLAPVSEVSAMQDDGLDTDSIAEEFGVSPMTISHQIDNKVRILSALSLG